MATKPTEPVTILSLRKLSLGTAEPQVKEPKTFTVEDAVETIGFGRFHIALFLIMGSTGVVEAMEIMLIAVVSPVIRCEWQLENWQVALVTTMVFFGYMVFSILFGLLADRYGRRKILLISFLWGAYFSLLTSFAPSYIWFVFLRTMVGCGVSAHSQWLIIKTEFLPTKYRGYMLPLSQVFWLAGSLLIIGLASVIVPTIGWRWLIRVASVPGIILIVAFKFIPESARFNVSTGNTQAALATLERIAKMNRSVMPEGKLVEPVLTSSDLWGVFSSHSVESLLYIYSSEVYPTTMRALGMGTSGSLCRIGAMVAPFISQVLMSASILGALCLFSSVCVVCAISAFTLPIETKGRALQQIK
ncbi:putative transporter SVOPL [Hylobates moloch]|uniref:putative transporter SVOPL n=1 Tax=Hylobates moloch TaxID=81572 RepID=UPI0026770B98|nr:putative transporter SVOPL [Hylobates moloch]